MTDLLSLNKEVKFLLIGGYGLLGNEIYHTFTKTEGLLILRLKRQELDLLNKDSIKKWLLEYRPDYIVNAAGYTDVNLAEKETGLAWQINCTGMYNLITTCKENNMEPIIISFSTDYVFNGEKRMPYTEEDLTSPVNLYGWTKVTSENILASSYSKFYIVRSSWLFGSNGRNFPEIIINKLQREQKFQVVSDQFGTPTYTHDLSKAMLKLLFLPYGIYHITNSGFTSWYDYAVEICKILNYDHSLITPVSTNEISIGVRRPAYSVLSNNKWNNYNDPMRDYKDALHEFLKKFD
jgi:dTDP-4-dehydrorhamnose reductase